MHKCKYVLHHSHILIQEHGGNWETPDGNTGGIEIETGGTTVHHRLDTIGGHAHAEGLSIQIPEKTVIAYRRDGPTIRNTQGYIKFRRVHA